MADRQATKARPAKPALLVPQASEAKRAKPDPRSVCCPVYCATEVTANLNHLLCRVHRERKASASLESQAQQARQVLPELRASKARQAKLVLLEKLELQGRQESR